MKRNLGNFDKLVRILIAVIVAALYFMHVITGTWALVMLIVGAVLLATTFINFCPLYAIFGINTYSKKNEKATA